MGLGIWPGGGRWKNWYQVGASEDGLNGGDNPAIGVQGGAVLLLDPLFRRVKNTLQMYKNMRPTWNAGWEETRCASVAILLKPSSVDEPGWYLSIRARSSFTDVHFVWLIINCHRKYHCKNSFSALAKDPCLAGLRATWNFSCYTWQILSQNMSWVISDFQRTNCQQSCNDFRKQILRCPKVPTSVLE